MLHIKEEAARCLLCEDAPCTKACIKGDPARAIRAIRFDNIRNAGRWIADCSDADAVRTAVTACERGLAGNAVSGHKLVLCLIRKTADA